MDKDKRVITDRDIIDEADSNPDPITGAPGAHPVGVGLGAAGAGAAGAAIGMVAGPIGSAVGAVVGAVAGGYAGKGVAESVNPTVEDTYWRENYANRPYVEKGTAYDQYQPAYRYGWESRTKYSDRNEFDEVEPDLKRNWSTSRGDSNMEWEKAKLAARDAWERVKHPISGGSDSDRDVNRIPR